MDRALLGARRTLEGPVREMLAESLGDRSLSIAYWLPDRGIFVDERGWPAELPEPGSGRAWTAVERDGQRVAAIIHDDELDAGPELVDAAAATAALAIDNERLKADLRARVQELRRSRLRIVEAADDARRRLERDLHDGAQQQLVSLALDLRLLRAQLQDHEAAELVDAPPRGSPTRSPSCASSRAASTRRSCPSAGSRRPSRCSPSAARSRSTGRRPRGAPRRVGRGRRLLRRVRGPHQRRQVRPQADHASVRIARDGDALQVVVADNGPGGVDVEFRQRSARPGRPRRGARGEARDRQPARRGHAHGRAHPLARRPAAAAPGPAQVPDEAAERA